MIIWYMADILEQIKIGITILTLTIRLILQNTAN